MRTAIFSKGRVSLLFFLSAAALILVQPGTASALQAVLTNDAYISSAQRNNAFGGDDSVRIDNARTGFLAFSVDNVLALSITGDDVALATLRLYVDSVTAPGTLDINASSGSWNETSITYNSAPAPGTPLLSGVSIAGPGFISVDVTPIVRDWLNGVANNGLVLVRSPGSSLSARFDAKEDPNTSHEAEIDITLAAADGVPSGAMLLHSGACPPTYTQVTLYDGRFISIGPTAGLTGGTISHVHAVGSYTVAGHTHTVGPLGGATDRRWVDDNSGGTDHWVSGENHTHSLTSVETVTPSLSGSSASTDSRPPFVTFVLCRKD